MIDTPFGTGLGHSGRQHLAEFAKGGVRAVVNLRHLDEADQPLRPDDAGEQVRPLGLDRVRIPVFGDGALR